MFEPPDTDGGVVAHCMVDGAPAENVYAPDVEGWVALGGIGFMVFVGFLLVVSVPVVVLGWFCEARRRRAK